jgi:hypothetical protein
MVPQPVEKAPVLADASKLPEESLRTSLNKKQHDGYEI